MRAPVSIAVQYWENTREPVEAFTQTLGGGGLFIETTSPAPVTTGVKVAFSLPGESRRHTVEGKVVWVRERFEGEFSPGMGIQYTKISREDRERIQEWIMKVLRGAE
ncbi:MAG: TIGR02266 family protein [Nitrospirae bacterium]|nr:TIGR02266 family protein [Nitrospirota bacterium]